MIVGSTIRGWKIMGLFPSVNGQWKITAQNGARVVVADRVRTEDLETFDPQAFWEKRR